MPAPLREPGGRRAGLLAGGALLLALLAGLLCARASLGRTASWSFPIDDAYIYANYTRALAAGHPFAYNFATDPGETSGGVTSAGWMLLLGAVYPLTALLGAAPAGIAPAAVRAAAPDPSLCSGQALACEAGRLYLAAYGLGAVLFAAAACAVGWLAWECYRECPSPLAPGLAGLAGAALLADPAAIWGAYSGLELPLSLLLIALAPASLLYELRTSATVRKPPSPNPHSPTPRLRWSLLAVALLPWARPELAVVGAVACLWLAGYLITTRGSFRPLLAYGAALAGGLAALAALFWVYTGRPLPSSFYAKVGGIRPDRLTNALQEWVLAGAWQPFVLLGAAALGALALWVAARRTRAASGGVASVGPSPILLVAGCAAAYFGAMLLALRWFGQEDRYILPIHALAWPLAGGLLAAPAALPGPAAWVGALRARPRLARALALAAGVAALLGYVGGLRVWAASDYALFVQNIEDAHVAPALWLAAQAPPGAVVAAEPIGAVHLFGGHPTVDVVGLTTPAQLGHYADWPATADLLRARGAQYLLYYPAWWPGGHPLPWAREVARFPVPDNRMAGDSPIAVYRLFGP